MMIVSAEDGQQTRAHGGVILASPLCYNYYRTTVPYDVAEVAIARQVFFLDRSNTSLLMNVLLPLVPPTSIQISKC